LRFNDTNNGIIFNNFFNEQHQEIRFVNLTISGAMELYSIVNVYFEDVVLNGSAIFDKPNGQLWNVGGGNNDEYLEKELSVTTTMTRFTYNAFTNRPHYCINIFGNVIINDSKFYGHSTCVNTIIDYRGEDIYKFIVDNSYFNGMYENKCINLFNSANAVISSLIFENGYAIINGGY